MPDVTYVGVHHFSWRNKCGVEKSEQCGCFHCMEYFPAAEVKEYEGETALCPKCGVDAVLPIAWVYPSQLLLEEMHSRYFKDARK